MLSGRKRREQVPEYYVVWWLFDVLYVTDKLGCLIDLTEVLVTVN